MWIRTTETATIQIHDQSYSARPDCHQNQSKRIARKLRLETSHTWGGNREKWKGKVVETTSTAQTRSIYVGYWWGSQTTRRRNECAGPLDQKQEGRSQPQNRQDEASVRNRWGCSQREKGLKRAQDAGKLHGAEVLVVFPEKENGEGDGTHKRVRGGFPKDSSLHWILRRLGYCTEIPY